ncbi:putative aflatoxin biosynthesis ketoreductase nor-1 protein [Neofusicoccum parvum UCRNP2]|uniref:Putative aflatoxin biosynthesis ketoreductase nor-1 protein n=1 Tax=Botryosphaeria parva (strain UCR-NP2) TaxID=1287680 RepID=R1GDP0_BOTPV|nr:putative aflatoxin biosynthesis ketoreductase nor-1 protein [Neofusicoccum parvum UCRNP2]
MASHTVVLITGVNRGIGRALFETYLSRPSHIVIGGVRDPASPISQSLHALPTGPNSKAIIIKIDSASETDARDAVQSLQANHDIPALHLVIANAGILAAGFPLVRDVRPADMKTHFDVNTVGPVILFQAVLPLLRAAARPPKFVTIGSSAGSIGGMELCPFPNAAYGPTKAALHYLTKKIHVEHPELIALPIDPGWLDGATREKSSGKLFKWDGEEFPW